MELKFVNTCPACPEQYDVYDTEDDTLVGYLRLRHGYLSVRCHGEQVYEADTKGDGTFYDSKEREYHLTKAAEAIERYLTHENNFDKPGDFVISV